MSAKDVRAELESLAKSRGATYFGIADLSLAKQFIADQGGEFLAQFPRAVSHGFVLADGVVDQVKYHEAPMAIHSYWHHVYRQVSPRLDSISLDLATAIQRSGFRAFVIPASQTIAQSRLWGVFSHKLAAHLAGHGWIGKSAMLITPEHGPRVRWGTVLTDAPLETGMPMEERCKGCHVCVDACPVQAFTGQAFDIPRPREDIFAAQKCYQYLTQRRKTIGVLACGMCVYICPFGQEAANKNKMPPL